MLKNCRIKKILIEEEEEAAFLFKEKFLNLLPFIMPRVKDVTKEQQTIPSEGVHVPNGLVPKVMYMEGIVPASLAH